MLFILSCDTGHDYKSYVIENFLSIEIPAGSVVKEMQGVDSYVSEIHNDNKLLATVQYGKYIYRLRERPFVVFPDSTRDSILKRLDNPGRENSPYFSATPEEDEEQAVFLDNYYRYDTINGILMKLVYPKLIGNGMTGVFIQSLKNGKEFSMYGKNLDSSQQIVMKEIIRSIKYCK